MHANGLAYIVLMCKSNLKCHYKKRGGLYEKKDFKRLTVWGYIKTSIEEGFAKKKMAIYPPKGLERKAF